MNPSPTAAPASQPASPPDPPSLRLDPAELVYLEGKGPSDPDWRRIEPAKTRAAAEEFCQLVLAPWILAGVEFRLVPAKAGETEEAAEK